MALTAIAQDLEGNKKLITPFKMVESSGVTKATEVYQALEAEKKSGIQFYCGDCYLDRDQLIDVVFRRTDARKTRPHFAHIGAHGGCAGSSPETVKHRTAKTVLATYLQEKGGRVEVEYTLNTGQAQLRRPDVFAEFIDRVEAHEIQVSPINGGEITQRTNDLLAHLKNRFPDHAAIVYWYLAPRNQKPDNWGSFNFIDRHGLILCFDEVTGAPVWQSYRPYFEAEQQQLKERQQAAEKKAADQARFSQRKAMPLHNPTPSHNPTLTPPRVDPHPNRKPGQFFKGDIVRGVKGRSSYYWTGRVVRPDRMGYIVYWDGRKNHKDPRVQKRPELFMLPEQIELRL